MDKYRAARQTLYDDTLARVTAEEEAARKVWWASVREVSERADVPADWDEAGTRRVARLSLAMGMERAYAAHRGIHHIHDYAESRASEAVDLAYPVVTPEWARGFLARFERRVSP